MVRLSVSRILLGIHDAFLADRLDWDTAEVTLEDTESIVIDITSQFCANFSLPLFYRRYLFQMIQNEAVPNSLQSHSRRLLSVTNVPHYPPHRSMSLVEMLLTSKRCRQSRVLLLV